MKERDVALQYIGTVDPDLLLVGFCLNDPQPMEQNWSKEREQFRDSWLYYFFSETADLLESFYFTRVASLLRESSFKVAEYLKIIPPWQTGLDRTYDRNSMEWKNFVGALRDIKKASDERGLQAPIFAVLNQSLDTGVAGDYRRITDHPYLKWYAQAAAAATEEGYAVVDFQKEIAALPPETSLVVNELDGHPSAILNQVYANKLAAIIENVMRQGGRGG